MPNPPKWPGFVARDILRVSNGRAWIIHRAFAEMLTGKDATDKLLPQLKMPVLIIWGGEDHITPTKLVAAYGIPLAPEPAYPAPKDAEWAWLVTGYDNVRQMLIDQRFSRALAVAPGTTDKAQSLDPTHKNLVTNGDVSRQIRYGEAKSEQLGIIIESDLNLQKATLPEDLRRFVVVMFSILGTIVLHV